MLLSSRGSYIDNMVVSNFRRSEAGIKIGTDEIQVFNLKEEACLSRIDIQHIFSRGKLMNCVID